jgi:hypothetical protein
MKLNWTLCVEKNVVFYLAKTNSKDSLILSLFEIGTFQNKLTVVKKLFQFIKSSHTFIDSLDNVIIVYLHISITFYKIIPFKNVSLK